MNKKTAIISDVHGRYKQLIKILGQLNIFKTMGGWRNSENYHIVQIGDLNDYAYEGNTFEDGIYSSLKAIDLAMELTEAGIMTVLYSNHHDKLKRYLNGNKVTPSHGLNKTIEELEDQSMDYKGELYTWLSRLPLTYEFTESDKRYICAHAYFDERMLTVTKSDPHWDETTKGRDWFKSMCIYGLTTSEGRVKWWDGDCSDRFQTFHFVGGHYHVEKFADNYSLLDNDDYVVCWIPSTGEVIREPK